MQRDLGSFISVRYRTHPPALAGLCVVGGNLGAAMDTLEDDLEDPELHGKHGVSAGALARQ